MGYDYLGTMSREQWNRMAAFVSASRFIIEEQKDAPVKGEPIDLNNTILIKHVRAQQAKALMEIDLLRDAAIKFNKFEGDIAWEKEIQDPLKYEKRTQFRLADGDTAILVQRIKDPIRQMFKRKKDNLEYRIKKSNDLIDQLENKVVFYRSFSYLLEGKASSDPALATVETAGSDQVVVQPPHEAGLITNIFDQIGAMFKDGYHNQNLGETSRQDKNGNVSHETPDANLPAQTKWEEQQKEKKYYMPFSGGM